MFCDSLAWTTSPFTTVHGDINAIRANHIRELFKQPFLRWCFLEQFAGQVINQGNKNP